MTGTGTLVSRFKIELLGQLVAAVSGALLLVSLARFLEPEAYGLLFLSISIFTILMVATKLGIGRSAGRYLSEYKDTDPAQIQHIILTSLLLNLSTVVVVGLGLLLGYRLLAELLGEPELAPLLALGVLYVVFGTLTKYVRLVLQGFEAIESAAAIHAIDRGGRLLFAIGLVLLGYGSIGALGGYILSYVVATLVGLAWIYSRYYRPFRRDVPIESGLRRRIAEYTLPLTATSTANVIEKQVDTVLVGFFLTPVAVSYYVISKQIVEFVEKPATALGFTLSPTLGAEKADDNLDHARDIIEVALEKSLLLYIPAAAGLIVVAEPTVLHLFGEKYADAIPVLQILGIYTVFRVITNTVGHGLDFMGRARERAIVKGITAALNFVLNILLIPRIGVVGAAIATVSTYGLFTVANLYLVHTELGLRTGYLLKQFVLISSITLVMSAIVFFSLAYVSGLLTLLSVIAFGTFVWGTLSISVGLLSSREIRSLY
ncbi:flippase [Natrarchaeobius halalkaliphilus]|uniref:Flippase n=1 Tax=Natrarchaeobius halalkaliphilus TaxID=1679091 RepID=A0A3N6MUZ1_9EURY|nr:flippase [Natrarchaeobius halalkaliphilus]RQG89222.1 flippase [Natrarchaeobius halalkaliphilus]